ncbi:MAG: HEAT repeat domain-containing protein [Candidatus Binatia bacterium]|nr:HEAT repeat domain-containing protein [Candidatus Binatia bacterium]
MQCQSRSTRLPSRLLYGLLCVTVLCFVPVPTQAQFLSQGERIGTQLSGDRVRDRINRKQKGANLTEWVRRLSNDRPETRLEAVKSLGNSKDPKAIEHLLGATADVDIRVKIKAIEYLGELRATDATPVLVQQLFLRDVNPGVKQKVLIALGKIGDPRGAQPIMEFLKRDLDEPTTGVALFALREVGNDSALAFLEDFSRTEPSPDLRRLASEAAKTIRHRLSPEFSPVVPTFVKQVELRTKAERGEQE